MATAFDIVVHDSDSLVSLVPEQIEPECRALQGVLKDLVHNKSLDSSIPTSKDLPKTSKKIALAIHIVFQNVARFLVKHHHKPDELCADIYDNKERVAEWLIHWMAPDPDEKGKSK